MKHLFLAIILMSFISCSDYKELGTDCIDEKLEQYGMVPYEGQELSSCYDFLSLYEYNGSQYFMFGNPCIDMISFMEDCNGENIEEIMTKFEYQKLKDNAIYVGIIGVKLND